MGRFSGSVGQVYSFKYNGGTTPGETRTVLVLSSSTPGGQDTVNAFDFERRAVRNFTVAKITELKAVAANYINADLLPSDLTAVHAAYAKDGKLTYFDGANGRLVVVAVPKVAMSFTSAGFKLSGPNGQVMFDLASQAVVLKDASGKYLRTIYNPTGPEFVSAVKGVE